MLSLVQSSLRAADRCLAWSENLLDRGLGGFVGSKGPRGNGMEGKALLDNWCGVGSSMKALRGILTPAAILRKAIGTVGIIETLELDSL